MRNAPLASARLLQPAPRIRTAHRKPNLFASSLLLVRPSRNRAPKNGRSRLQPSLQLLQALLPLRKRPSKHRRRHLLRQPLSLHPL
jgi:hypothetical protein